MSDKLCKLLDKIKNRLENELDTDARHEEGEDETVVSGGVLSDEDSDSDDSSDGEASDSSTSDDSDFWSDDERYKE